MNNLFTTVFGVFISSSDDDFENFINAIKTVMIDKESMESRNIYSLCVVIFVICLLFISIFLFLYSKLIVQK
ncbi:IMV membrane protein [Sea otter poxvirus]|uniref:IMV membrane protein n=1 Tax=Sea otter poxvirus TaxID=1416741 RepID=A0A2U9QHL3_9POXV|nr:IMV membrane protein [Sea otter poxvirus]AWU47089.1 IMV membrane protein [Sea otter poxvirus]